MEIWVQLNLFLQCRAGCSLHSFFLIFLSHPLCFTYWHIVPSSGWMQLPGELLLKCQGPFQLFFPFNCPLFSLQHFLIRSLLVNCLIYFNTHIFAVGRGIYLLVSLLLLEYEFPKGQGSCLIYLCYYLYWRNALNPNKVINEHLLN